MTKWYKRDGSLVEAEVEVLKAGETAQISVLQTCYKCGGNGGSSAWNRTGWTCYKCGGVGNLGWRVVKLYSAEKLAKLEASKAKRDATLEAKRLVEAPAKAAAEEAERALSRSINMERYPEACKILDGEVEGSFLNDVKASYLKGYILSDAQCAAVVKSAERAKEWAARDEMINKFEKMTGTLEDGRLEVTAALINTKWVETNYGSSIKALWMTNKGIKLWGTLPAVIPSDSKGKVFKFSATIEMKEPKFGFYKRPAKVSAA